MKTSRAEKERIWTECMHMYLSKFSPEVEAWLRANSRSRRYVGTPWDACETVYAQVMAMMFPGEDWLSLEPSERGSWEDDDHAAKHLTILMHQQHKRSKFKQQWGRNVVLQQLIFGSAPFTSSWDIQWTVDYPTYGKAMAQYDQKNTADWQMYQAQMMQFQTMARAAVANGADPSQLPPPPQFRVPGPPIAEKKIAYQGPYLEAEDLFNFVIDQYPNRREGALRIKRTFKTLDYLKKFAKPDPTGYCTYEGLENLSEVDLKSSRHAVDGQALLRAAAFGFAMPQQNRGVELLEAQGDMEIPLGGSGGVSAFVNFTATVANEKHLLRFEPGFMWIGEPSTQLAAICVPPGETYGVGILENGRGTNELLQVRANQMVDVVSAVINPEYKVIDDGIIDLTATSRPGKRHVVGKMDNMEPIRKDFAGAQLGMQDISMIKAEFQQLTRSSNPSVPSYQRSATEIQRDTGINSVTLTEIVRQMEEGGLTTALEHQICMNAMFTTQSVFIMSTQDGKASWMPVSPEAIRRGWLVEVRGSQHVAERAKRVQDLLFFMQLTGSNPIYAPFIRHLQMLKMAWSEMGNHNKDQVFVDEQTGTALLIEMMMNGTLMKGTGGGNAEGSSAGAATGAPDDAEGSGTGPAAGGFGPGVSDDPSLPGDGLLSALQGMRA
jgi:hypothetical protein